MKKLDFILEIPVTMIVRDEIQCDFERCNKRGLKVRCYLTQYYEKCPQYQEYLSKPEIPRV